MRLCTGMEDCEDFQCPHCGSSHEAEDWCDEMDGIDVSTCKACDKQFVIVEHRKITYEIIKR